MALGESLFTPWFWLLLSSELKFLYSLTKYKVTENVTYIYMNRLTTCMSEILHASYIV